jgi:hypothetical protein
MGRARTTCPIGCVLGACRRVPIVDGQVEYHLNPDRDDFKTFPRCEFHQQKRLDQAAETMRKYPKIAPSGFDPMDAGETWDEEY